MTARLRSLLQLVAETFWLVPASMVIGGILLAVALVELDRSGLVPAWLLQDQWFYNGGGTGARTLLGAVASSTIGVAGTVFSITIAALSLAAGQMGPRLLRNFTRDRGNQFTLGAFLATFSYALMVLRTVRTEDEGAFTPYVALTVSIVLAFICVGVLVFFVGHMAGRINVDTVIEIVSNEVRAAVARILPAEAGPDAEPPVDWDGAQIVRDPRQGYLQSLDAKGLAAWAAEHGTVIRLLIRPGDYVFPGAPVAIARPPVAGLEGAVRDVTALGAQRLSAEDLEFSVRQLVEVAVRALSPSINDPHTAMSVLDRLASALCEVAELHMPTGVHVVGGRVVLVTPAVDYPGLVDAMFHMIRQYGAESTAVIIRLLEVLTAVLSCEQRPDRVATLQRHADLALDAAERGIRATADLADVRRRYQRFAAMRREGVLAAI